MIGPVKLNPFDPALAVLEQAERLRGFIRTSDQPTREREVLRLVGFCIALLEYWEDPIGPEQET